MEVGKEVTAQSQDSAKTNNNTTIIAVDQSLL